jgi:hypothetical protein
MIVIYNETCPYITIPLCEFVGDSDKLNIY